MADIIFEISARTGSKAERRLKWASKGLDSAATSGPFGNGTLPIGSYTAQRSKLLDKPNPSSYCDTANPVNCWMQVIEPNFSTSRTDLGIHPDGGTPGTEGCIGIKDANTKTWFDAFRSVVGNIIVEVRDSEPSLPDKK